METKKESINITFGARCMLGLLAKSCGFDTIGALLEEISDNTTLLARIRDYFEQETEEEENK